MCIIPTCMYMYMDMHMNVHIQYFTQEDLLIFLKENEYIIGPNQSTSYSWNLMAQEAKHDIIFLKLSDLQIFTIPLTLDCICYFLFFGTTSCLEKGGSFYFFW
jgi:hypothetical protein